MNKAIVFLVCFFVFHTSQNSFSKEFISSTENSKGQTTVDDSFRSSSFKDSLKKIIENQWNKILVQKENLIRAKESFIDFISTLFHKQDIVSQLELELFDNGLIFVNRDDSTIELLYLFDISKENIQEASTALEKFVTEMKRLKQKKLASYNDEFKIALAEKVLFLYNGDYSRKIDLFQKADLIITDFLKYYDNDNIDEDFLKYFYLKNITITNNLLLDIDELKLDNSHLIIEKYEDTLRKIVEAMNNELNQILQNQHVI